MLRLYFIVTTAIVAIFLELEASVCIAFMSTTTSKPKLDSRQAWAINAVEKGTVGALLSTDSVMTTQDNIARSTQQPSQRNTGVIETGTSKERVVRVHDRYKHQQKQRIRAMFREAKAFERTGRWREACSILSKILRMDPYDAHSHLAFARIQSRRENRIHNTTHFNNSLQFDVQNDTDTSQARRAFMSGTQYCPDSVHLWHAWAMHEEGVGNMDYAKSLYQTAMNLDPLNPYVCHSYALLEQRSGNIEYAEKLLRTPLESSNNASCTAALVCSLGELLTNQGRNEEARSIYLDNVQRISSERQVSEVYLAAAWLEEKHFHDQKRAEELLHLTLTKSPDNSRAHVALARLEGRKVEGTKNIDRTSNHSSNHTIIAKESSFHGDVTITRSFVMRNRLQNLCINLEREHNNVTSFSTSEVKDGRLFNTWANLEIQCGNYTAARDILARGMRIFPRDHSIVQAAGNVEERLGNLSAANEFYSSSLSIQPSAPTLIAIAMLELRNRTQLCNMTKVERLFEEALLLDRRHGPIYNAYGTMELQRGNIEKARGIYIRGLQTRCTATASVYHGLAKLELSLGNLESARTALMEGLKDAEFQDTMMDNHQRDRASFLVHTLGMLELRCNRAAEAKQVFLDGIKRHGGSSQLLLGAALTELKLGNEDRARHLFEQAVTANKKHAQAWQSWGVYEMRAGNYRLAKSLFELGIRNDPTHGALWQAYATLEGRRGNVLVARGLFAAGVLKCPSHVPLYQAWACLELRSENIERAKILISEALTRDKSRGSSWRISAKIEEKLGNGGLVRLILQRGLECSPCDPELYRAAAELEVKRGHFHTARSLFEKGLEIDPTHAPLYHSFAELEAMVFNIEGLAKLNKKAAQIFNTNALMPTQAQASVLRRKLRASGGVLPDGISILGKELEMEMMDVEEIITDIDPEEIIQGLSDTDFNHLILKIK